MKYQELPLWAREEVKQTVISWVLEDDPSISRVDLIDRVSEYIDEHDNFEIEYDEYGENPTVNW